jgi:ferrous iron transport protein B
MENIVIALAGNPNAGKTSLFNRLTGARAHVGNYPGVTVEKREGRLRHGDSEIRVVDLPGTYSLTAYSLEEIVAREFILHERPDVVVDVVDAANLERNLYLAVQFMEMNARVVIALNMVDVAESRGLKIDVDKLSTLLGVPVVPTVARTGQGLDQLMDTVLEVARQPRRQESKRIRYGPDLDNRIRQITQLLEQGRFAAADQPTAWLAIKILEGDSKVQEILDQDPEAGRLIRAAVDEVTRHLRTTLDDEPDGVIADHRYGFITSITKQAVTAAHDLRRTVTDQVDMVVLNRLLGPVILLLVLYGLYQFTFWVSAQPVAGLEALFSWLGDSVRKWVPPGPLQSLLASGIIDGVGGVMGFVPLIAFMFFGIAILEDSGYMARIAFIMDRVLRTFGLHGSSVLALMIGGGLSGGCAVPGVMAARTLRDPKERLATVLVTPFMNCGAKLPVFAVLIAAFFAEHQAPMMFMLTLLAWALALVAARILRWTILRGEHTPFVMELPPYRMPTLRGLLIHTWERIWEYLKKAGTVILAISVIIWAMMTYPGLPGELSEVFDHQRAALEKELVDSPVGDILGDWQLVEKFEQYRQSRPESPASAVSPAAPTGWSDLARAVTLANSGAPIPVELASYQVAARAYLDYLEQATTLAKAKAQAALRVSAAGRLGTAMEFLSRPLGFDWRTNIALTGGFAAKEVVIATLGTAYSLGQGETRDDTSLAQKLAAEPGWNPLVAFTLMLFVMMYSPCSVTLVTIGREVGWKWAVFSMVYSTSAAYIICLAVSLVGRSLG